MDVVKTVTYILQFSIMVSAVSKLNVNQRLGSLFPLIFIIFCSVGWPTVGKDLYMRYFEIFRGFETHKKFIQ